MDLKLGSSIHNRFDIRVIRDGEVVQEAYAENIVLDRMYTKICAFTNYFDYIWFGTGSGTLSAARTTLFTPTSYKSASTVESVYAFPVSKITKKIQIMPEEYVGSSLTEVGISESTSNINTHALIKDSEGVQISITKTNLDLIEIYATVYVELNDDEVNGIYWNRPASSNKLLSYFIGGSTFSYMYYTYTPAKGVYSPYGSYSSKSTTLTSYSSSKKVTFASQRYAVGESNVDIGKVGVDGVCHLNVPGAVYSGAVLTETFVGDGVKTNFNLVHSKISNVIVTVDGVASTDFSLTPIFSTPVMTWYTSNVKGSYFYSKGVMLKHGYLMTSTGTSAVYIVDYEIDGVFTVIQKLETVGDIVSHSYDNDSFLLYDGTSYLGFKWSESDNKYVIDDSSFLSVGDIYVKADRTFKVRILSAYWYFYYKVDGAWVQLSSPQAYHGIGYNYGIIEATGFAALGNDYYLIGCTSPFSAKVVVHYDSETQTLTEAQRLNTNFPTLSHYCSGYLFLCKNGTSYTFDVYQWDVTTSSFILLQSDLVMESISTMLDVGDGVFLCCGLTSCYFRYVVRDVNTGKFTYIGTVVNLAISSSITTYHCVNKDGWVLVFNGNYVYAYDVTFYKKAVAFLSPPAVNSVISVSYHTDSIPKTTDYVIDVGFTLQFGEGTI